MANINGVLIKRTTLTSGTEAVVEFSERVQSISLCSNGGVVYVKFNGTISGTSDTGAISMNDGDCFETYKKAPISTLHLYSESAATVQWDIP